MSGPEHRNSDGSYSWSDWVEVVLDGPADDTVRPIPPERLAQAKALRDQILAAEAAGIDPYKCVDVWIEESSDTEKVREKS